MLKIHGVVTLDSGQDDLFGMVGRVTEFEGMIYDHIGGGEAQRGTVAVTISDGASPSYTFISAQPKD